MRISNDRHVSTNKKLPVFLISKIIYDKKAAPPVHLKDYCKQLPYQTLINPYDPKGVTIYFSRILILTN